MTWRRGGGILFCSYLLLKRLLILFTKGLGNFLLPFVEIMVYAFTMVLFFESDNSNVKCFSGVARISLPMFLFFSHISQTLLGDPVILLHLPAPTLWFSYDLFYWFFFCISSIIPLWHFFSNYIFLLNFIFVSWYAFYVSLSSSFLLSWHIFIFYFSCLSIVIITILHSFSGRSFRGFTAVELERGRSWVGFSCYFFFSALEFAHLKLCISRIFLSFCSNCFPVFSEGLYKIHERI